MKRIAFAMAAFLIFSGNKASAQYYFYDANSYDSPVMFELGGSVGIMNCLTDVGGKRGMGKPFIKDLNLGNTQVNGSVYLSVTYKDKIGLRVEGTFGTVKSYDSILATVKEVSQGRYERNLSFKTKINEISLIAEFHPLFIFIDWPGRDEEPPLFSPYLAGGIGYFTFNPQAKSRTGEYVDLEPLHLEGQGLPQYPDRKPYKLSQVCIPVGAGFRYEITPALNVRAEFLHRTLFTDYLDDVSTRYIDPVLFGPAGFGFTGKQLENALDLRANQRTNIGTNSSIFRKTDGGIRGDPTNKDSYFTFNVKLGLTFGREKIRR